jgi:hypothetical protein
LQTVTRPGAACRDICIKTAGYGDLMWR